MMQNNFAFITTADLSRHNGERTHVLEFIRHFSGKGLTHVVVDKITEELYFELNNKAKILCREVVEGEGGSRSPFRVGSHLWLSIRKIIKEKGVDFLYIREGVYTSAVQKLLRRSKLPYFVEINGVLTWEMQSRGFPRLIRAAVGSREKRLLEGAEASFCVASGIRAYLKDNHVLGGNPCYIHNNGVNLGRFRLIGRDACIKRTKLPEHECYVGFIGHLTAWQNFDYMLRVVRVVKESNNDLDVVLLVVGGGGGYDALERKVRDYGLSDRVILTGEVEHDLVPYYMSLIDLGLVIDTRFYNEAPLFSPLKLYEYLACGVQVLAPKGIGEIRNREFEIVSSLSTEDTDWAKAIMDWYGAPSEYKSALKKAARQYAHDNCSWEKVFSEVSRQIGKHLS